ncbi:MAG: hypothetical protein ACRYFK_07450 [Janthinobacterium lividum]
MSIMRVIKELLSSPFAKGMVKAVDIAGNYDVRAGGTRTTLRNADDLPTPTVQDDVRHMRGDFNRVGGDMRKALKKHSALAK